MWFFLIFLAGIIVMYKASDWVIKYSLNLSRVLGVSTFVIGFILISVSTSLPEMFVGVFSALKNEAGLAVGNLLGANLYHLTIVITIITVLGGAIYMKREEDTSLIRLLFISSLITIFIFQAGGLTLIHGFVLIILFGFLVRSLYKTGRVSEEVVEQKEKERRNIALLSLKFFISVALLLIAAYIIVDSSIQMANFFSIATTTVGMIVVALGTVLPELSVELRAVQLKQYSLALGDLLGSSIANITLVLGIVSILSPTSINLRPLAGLLPFLLISILFIWYSLETKKKLTKNEGLLLLGLYVLFLLAEFLLGQVGIPIIFG
jgi:cation:H+ antiporter